MFPFPLLARLWRSLAPEFSVSLSLLTPATQASLCQ